MESTTLSVFNYIEQVFIFWSSIPNGVRLTASVEGESHSISIDFLKTEDTKHTNPELHPNEAFTNLSKFLSKKRKVFIGSKKNFKDVLSSETISFWRSSLIKNESIKIMAEVFNYVNIDEYCENMGIPLCETLEEIHQMANKLIHYDLENDKVWAKQKVAMDEEIRRQFDSLSWTNLILMGNANLEKMFALFGNPMLGSSFNIKEQERAIEYNSALINISANRETFICDLENKSMIGVSKCFFRLEKIDNNLYRFYGYTEDGTKVGIKYDKNADRLESKLREFTLALPIKRTFIGWEDETIENLNELLKEESISDDCSKILLELRDSYIDFKQPFSKIFPDITLEDLSKIFKTKFDKKDMCFNIFCIHKSILDNVPKSIEHLNNHVFKQFPLVNDIGKIKENYLPFFNTIWGQAFKYLYCCKRNR